METFKEFENHDILLDPKVDMALPKPKLSFKHEEAPTLKTIKESPLPLFIDSFSLSLDLDNQNIESNTTKEKNLTNELSAALISLPMLDPETFLVIQPEEYKPVITNKIIKNESKKKVITSKVYSLNSAD